MSSGGMSSGGMSSGGVSSGGVISMLRRGGTSGGVTVAAAAEIVSVDEARQAGRARRGEVPVDLSEGIYDIHHLPGRCVKLGLKASSDAQRGDHRPVDHTAIVGEDAQ